MRAALRSGFAMEVFSAGGGYEGRLPDFLNLYLQHFPPAHRTKTNELVDFLSNPDEGRDLHYFGLTYEGDPCGFAVLMYYPAHLVGVFDFLVIKPTVRGYGAFFAFADLITTYMERKRLSFDYLLAEVLLDGRGVTSRIGSSLLIRLMRLVGFRVATLPYWAPDPEISTRRDDCRAALLILSEPEREYLEPDEISRLTQVVYIDHYFRWYQRYMTSARRDEYLNSLTKTLEQMKQHATGIGRIKLNGGKNMEMVHLINQKPADTLNSVSYVWFLAIPAGLSVILGLVEAPWITLISLAVGTAVLAVALINPRFRRWLTEFFRTGS